MSSKTSICSFLSCCLRCISRAHLANICLWTATLLCTISFACPSWVVIKEALAYKLWGKPRASKNIGILGECCTKDGQNIWVWEEEFQLIFDIEEWRRVMLFIILVGLLLLLPVLLMSPFRFCCKCGQMSVRISKVSAVLTSLSACLFGSAEIYFFFVVVGAYRDPILTIGRLNSWSWAFEVCGAGTCFAFASSFFWYLDSRRDVDYVPFEDQNELRLERR